MLRYVFDSADQLRNHLHLADGHALLFFPAPSAPGLGGERVLVDLEIPSEGQHIVLRGTVQSRVVQSGIWVDFPDASVVRKLQTSAIARRQERRFGTDVSIEMENAAGERVLARLLDISAHGARLGACRLPVGTPVKLSLPLPVDNVPRQLGRATVIRSAARDCAVRFARDDEASRAAIAALTAAMHERWQRATTLQHGPLCCGDNGVSDPPPPRLRPRD